jgi:hypothetical protein
MTCICESIDESVEALRLSGFESYGAMAIYPFEHVTVSGVTS